MMDSLASSRTFRACSCGNRTWNRGHRVHARCRTVLDPLKPSVPAPAGTAPGTGVREYMQDAGQSCIFQNLPCLLLQEPHLEQGSESTCKMMDSLSSSRTFCTCSCRNRTWNRGQRVHARCWIVLHLPEPSVPAPAGTAPGTGVREYMQDDGQSFIF